MAPLLQGELFKQGKDSWSAFNLRWVELLQDGTLSWYDKEGSQPNGSLNVHSHSVVIDSEVTTNKDGEQRFGFRLVPATGRQYALQASSHEERHMWTMTMDLVAHPDVTRHDAGIGRVLKVRRPARPAKLGLDLGSSNSMPGVVVMRISGELANAGLFPGDCVLAVNNTVLRNSLVAARAFGREENELTLRLLGWNREARIIKHAGVAGLTACTPARGPGVLVSGLVRDGAAHEAGLHIGDRILAVNGEALLDSDHEAVSKKILSATSDVRLTVSGSTVEVFVRKVRAPQRRCVAYDLSLAPHVPTPTPTCAHAHAQARAHIRPRPRLRVPTSTYPRPTPHAPRPTPHAHVCAGQTGVSVSAYIRSHTVCIPLHTVTSGYIPCAQDTDGRLGLGFVTGGTPRLMQGAVVCESVPR